MPEMIGVKQLYKDLKKISQASFFAYSIRKERRGETIYSKRFYTSSAKDWGKEFE